MQNQLAPVCAAIDIGSNTIHVVVARAFPDHLDILADEVELVRIGESVNATGAISDQKLDDSLTVLRQYQALASSHHADPVLVVATEAIRQATNSESFLSTIKRETGLDVSLIPGDLEATLTFYGSTYELASQSGLSALTGVMDLGGGSTELVLAKYSHISWRTSVPVGSGWLHDRYFRADPPTHEDLDVARTFLRTYFRGLPIKQRPDVLLATGGSANTLLHLARTAFNLDSQQHLVTYADLVRCEGLLNALSSSEIAERYHIPPGRARILPSGLLIIQAVMQRFHLQELHISPHGIREGCLLAYARYGSDWLQQVSLHARNPAHPPANNTHQESPDSFIHTGRYMLSERLQKMLEWRSEVLKHEDIEAVHKMRVASRRLRASLDAYQSTCDPRAFKKTYRQVKALADVLGKARDTDVMIEHLRSHLTTADPAEQIGISWLIDRLQSYREQHQQQLEQFLLHLDDTTLKRHLDACLPQG